MGTREEILAAAGEIMREQGYARATTKEIARAAGYSEAALYKHFRDKTAIFVAVLSEQLPALGATLAELTEHAGKGTVKANLTTAARTALDFYAQSFPIAASVFATQELLAAHRSTLRELGAGPRHPHRGLAGYLRAEQRLGRLPRTADVDGMAALLLGACFQQAFLIQFEGDDTDLDALARKLVKTLMDAGAGRGSARR